MENLSEEVAYIITLLSEDEQNKYQKVFQFNYKLTLRRLLGELSVNHNLALEDATFISSTNYK